MSGRRRCISPDPSFVHRDSGLFLSPQGRRRHSSSSPTTPRRIVQITPDPDIDLAYQVIDMSTVNNIPIFDGHQKKVSVEAFILAVDNAQTGAAGKIDDAGMSRIAMANLTDYASQWIMSERLKPKGKDFDSWPTMKKRMKDWFGQKATLGAKAAKYGDLKKKSEETFRMFLTRCESSVMAIDKAEDRITDKIRNCSDCNGYWTCFDVRVRDFFVAGLTPELSRYLELNIKGVNADTTNMLVAAEEWASAGRQKVNPNASGGLMEITEGDMAAQNQHYQNYLKNGGVPEDYEFGVALINNKSGKAKKNNKKKGKKGKMDANRARSPNRQLNIKITQSEVDRSYSWEGSCWSCWDKGHLKPDCPNQPRTPPSDFPGYQKASAILRARRMGVSLVSEGVPPGLPTYNHGQNPYPQYTPVQQQLGAIPRPSAPTSVYGGDTLDFNAMYLNSNTR